MSEPLKLTVGNCTIEYRYIGNSISVIRYDGKARDVIRELLEQHLQPQKRYLEHPYHPEQAWWGNNPV